MRSIFWFFIGTEGLDEVMGGRFTGNHFFLVNGETSTSKAKFGMKFLINGVRVGQQSDVRKYP